MFKKFIFGILLAASTSLSYAGGFYLGPGLQYESIEAISSYQAISPRLTAGYKTPLNEFYALACEIFAAAGTLEQHPTGSGLNNTPTFGASLLPGFVFGQRSFGFGRLGLVGASFSAQTAMVWGAQAGLGIETPLVSSWDIRGEYDYTAYQNVSMTGSPKSNALVIAFIYVFNAAKTTSA